MSDLDNRRLESPGAPFFANNSPQVAALGRSGVWSVVAVVCTSVADYFVLNGGLELPQYTHAFIPLTVVILRGIAEGIIDTRSVNATRAEMQRRTRARQ